MKPKPPLTHEWSAVCSERNDTSPYLLGPCTFVKWQRIHDKGAALLPLLPENVYVPEKKTKICIGFVFLLVWWSHVSWNGHPYITHSHGGTNRGKYIVSWLLAYTTAVTVSTNITSSGGCICSFTNMLVTFTRSLQTYINILLICHLTNIHFP